MKLELLELQNRRILYKFGITHVHRTEYVSSDKHYSMFYIALEILPKGKQYSTLSTKVYHTLAIQLMRLQLMRLPIYVL